MQMFENISGRIYDYLTGCNEDISLQDEHLSGAGYIFLLEEKLKKFYRKRFAVCFSNATTALNALCLAYELKNSEIISTPLTWGGTISPFLYNSNKIIFSDIDKNNLCLSPSGLKKIITNKTKAVVSVDYAGNAADSSSIKIFCKKNNLIYISDSSQSLGAYRVGYPAGYFADTIVISFGSRKTIFGGEGGAIISDDANLYEKLIWFTQHPLRQRLIFGLQKTNEFGINGRMNPLAAIVALETFSMALKKIKLYQKKCFMVLEHLSDEKLISHNSIKSENDSTFFYFLIAPSRDISIEIINCFLNKYKFNFIAQYANLKMIYGSKVFSEQFKNSFIIDGIKSLSLVAQLLKLSPTSKNNFKKCIS